MHIGTRLTRDSARLQDRSQLGATAAPPLILMLLISQAVVNGWAGGNFAD